MLIREELSCGGALQCANLRHYDMLNREARASNCSVQELSVIIEISRRFNPVTFRATFRAKYFLFALCSSLQSLSVIEGSCSERDKHTV